MPMGNRIPVEETNGPITAVAEPPGLLEFVKKDIGSRNGSNLSKAYAQWQTRQKEQVRALDDTWFASYS